jgi:dynein heavy chain
MPGADIVRSIYASIVDGHVAGASLDEGVARLAPKLVDATIELHRMVGARAGRPALTDSDSTRVQTPSSAAANFPVIQACFSAQSELPCPTPPLQVMHNFLPSAVKFHYQFNLRELSNVVGGLCRMTREEYREPVKVGGLGAGGGLSGEGSGLPRGTRHAVRTPA